MKNQTEVTLNPSSNSIARSNDEINFHHEILLADA